MKSLTTKAGLAKETARTILVVSDWPDMSANLNDSLDRSYVLVRPVREDEVLEGITACNGWPWMIVSDAKTLSASTLSILKCRPILLTWRGSELPTNIPKHAQSFAKWSDLVNHIKECLNKEVAGMKLAIETGVDLPDGGHTRSIKLQAIVANYPQGWDLSLSSFAPVNQVLTKHQIPYHLVTHDGLIYFEQIEEK